MEQYANFGSGGSSKHRGEGGGKAERGDEEFKYEGQHSVNKR
jgi:hypothetical protein